MWLIECPRCGYESSSKGFNTDSSNICDCPECNNVFDLVDDLDDCYEWEDYQNVRWEEGDYD